MEEVLNYLRECGTFYIATNEDGQPRVRPFGAVAEFEGKLYFVTNNQKKVYEQMMKNPKIEISAMNKGNWIRVEGKVVCDDRLVAREKMIAENKVLTQMYTAKDGLMEVLYIEEATATIYSYTKEPIVIKF